MAELKPCPFCGGEAKIVTYRNEYSRINPTLVGCSVCKTQTALYDKRKEAIKAWNRRADNE